MPAFNRTLKRRTTDEEIRTDVKRAISALKGSQTSLSENNVVKQAHGYHKLSPSAIKRYVANLGPEERIEHGYPDPNAKSQKIETRPTIDSRRTNWRSS